MLTCSADAPNMSPPGAGEVTLPDGVPPALNTEQAAVYTGLSAATLEGLRCKGGGPRFVRYGRRAVRYLVRDLDAWMAQLTVASTSEAVG